jgi:hypothetical protein
MKTTALAICAFALSTTLAFAQPSQAQGGAATGPTSNSATSESSGMKGATTNGSGMQSGSTMGMSSGAGSSVTNSGGANGNPNSMPKATTAPSGDALKDESPAK